MTERIALTINSDNRLCPFPESAYVKIMKKTSESWQTEKLLPIDLQVTNTEELRARIRTLLDALPECKILLSASISGIPYHIFDKMGFAIFEAPSVSDSLLNDIIKDVVISKEELAADILMPRSPIEITPGCYYFDYLLLESKHPEITTKKALLPFFDSTPFFSLTVRLSHLPPWLETGEYAKRYEISSKKSDNAVLVAIKNKICKE
ncbi:MAG: Fe-only nitrogenase accessory AnfO family protein [Acidaminococcaceae bacterium]